MALPNITTPKEDPRIPPGFEIREYDLDQLSSSIRDLGCRWLARHEGDSPCDWFARTKSYPGGVMAARVHSVTCKGHKERKRKPR